MPSYLSLPLSYCCLTAVLPLATPGPANPEATGWPGLDRGLTSRSGAHGPIERRAVNQEVYSTETA